MDSLSLCTPAAPTTAASASAAPGLPISLLGVPFDPLTLEGAVDRIDEMVDTWRPHHVVTAEGQNDS